MAARHIDASSLRDIKREARRLSRAIVDKTYMQHLNEVARNRFGVRHYHEAQTRAKRAQSSNFVALDAQSPLIFYLQSCQEYYLDF